LGGACLGAQDVLLKGGAAIGNGFIFQEVRPEDKMAAGLYNDGIIVLSMTSDHNSISAS
jgi:hypothetical protein